MSANPLTCAYCRQHAAVSAFLPFCSERCKMADLGQWLSGNYRLPATDQIDDDADAGAGDETDTSGRDR